MTSPAVRLRSRLATWAGEELAPAALRDSLTAALVLALIEIIFALSVVALIFTGPLADRLPQAIGLVLIGNALLALTVTLFGGYGGARAVVQDPPGVILAVAVASIAASVVAAGTPDRLWPTVMVLLIGCTLATGLVLVLLGVFRLGGLARYLPFPVIGGFLAGTGWMLVAGGVGVAHGAGAGPGLLQANSIARWLPALVLGGVMLAVVMRTRKAIVIGPLFLGAVLLFYAVMAAGGKLPATLSAEGWLIGPFAPGPPWRAPLDMAALAQVDGAALWRAMPIAAPAVFISVVGLLLNITSVELMTSHVVRLDRELKTTGIANLLSGLAGGLIGYHATSTTAIAHSLGRNRRLPGVLVALLIALTAAGGLALLAYVPRPVLGGLLVFVGLAMLHEWLIESRTSFTRVDHLVIVTIFVIIVGSDFLWGVGVGLVLAIVLFVVNYSRVDLVRHEFSAATMHSRVSRDSATAAWLVAQGGQVLVLQLQGYIFFGTANSLFERVQQRVSQPLAAVPPLRYLLLDFKHVSGLDATGALSFGKVLHLTRRHGIELVLTQLPERMREPLAQHGVGADGAGLHRFADLDHGLEWCEESLLAAAGSLAGQERSLVDALCTITPDRERVAALVAELQREAVEPGDVVLQQGDASDELVFIESGRFTAQLERPGLPPLRLQTMRGGQIVGEQAFFERTRRSVSVVADSAGVVHRLDRLRWEAMCQREPELARTLDRLLIHLLNQRVGNLTRAVDSMR